MPIAKGRGAADIARLFPAQRSELDCVPTCLRSILEEFSEREGTAQKVALRRIDQACGYEEEEGSITDGLAIKAVLDPALRRQRQECEFRAAPGADLALLGNLLKDPEASFPIVGFHEGYFHDAAVGLRGDPQGYGHAVVLLGLSPQAATIYDPLLALQGGQAADKYILGLPLVRFEQHWHRNDPPNWVLWIRRRGKQTNIRTLADYETR